MKKFLCISLVLFVLAALCACKPAPVTVSVTTATPTISETVSATEAATAAPTATPVETPTEAPSEAPTPSPTPTGPTMYSSYAYLKSFDPATGVAQFDYFDMLRGADAVDYLVAHDGYTQADAQSLVDNFADSEFVEKNTNPQLRAIDLDDVSLSLMYQPSGEMVTGAEPVPSTAGDFRAIYALDSFLLIHTYFYYIHVAEDGHVYWVEQVFWP